MSAVIFISNPDSYDFEVEKCRKICEENHLHVSEIVCKAPEDLLNFPMTKGQCLVTYSLYNISPTQVTFFNVYDYIEKMKGFILTHDNQIDTRKESHMLGLYSWYYSQLRTYGRQEVIDMAKKAIGLDLSFIQNTIPTSS